MLENPFWGSVTAHPWQGDIFESVLLYSYRNNYPYKIPIPIFIFYLPPPKFKGAHESGLLLTSSVHFAQNKVAPKIQRFWLISESQNLAIICSVVASFLSLSVKMVSFYLLWLCLWHWMSLSTTSDVCICVCLKSLVLFTLLCNCHSLKRKEYRNKMLKNRNI